MDTHKPSRESAATKVPFGEFEQVELKAVGLNETFAGVKANRGALRKISEFLIRELKRVFPDLVYAGPAEDAAGYSRRIR